jgi:ssDNA-binding Zn-finger/Zn-ribbon topoisomerase 1
MKRPQRVYKTVDGHELPMTASQEKEAGERLFQKVLQWRSISPGEKKTCDRCSFTSKSRKFFVIHHRHYETLDCEIPADVCLLCKSCHDDLHTRWNRMDLTESDIPYVPDGLAETLKDKKNPFAAADGEVLCPICRSLMTKRYGRYGCFWGCTGYPACKGTRKASYTPPLPVGTSTEEMYQDYPVSELTSLKRIERWQRYGHLFSTWLCTFRKPDGSEFTVADRYADEEDARRNFQAQNEFLGWGCEIISVAKVE